MTSMASRNVLIITDSVELGLSIQRVLSKGLSTTAAVFSITYPESKVFLTPGRVEETSLFILELFRSYPGGLRAEALVLADRWRKRKPSLVVSSLYLSRELRCVGYWDVAADDMLVSRVERIMRFPERCFEGFDRLFHFFEPLLSIPPQHEI